MLASYLEQAEEENLEIGNVRLSHVFLLLQMCNHPAKTSAEISVVFPTPPF